MDLPDEVGQPGMPNRSPGRRPVAPLIVARCGHTQVVAGSSDSDAVIVEFGHETVPVFWGHHLLDGRGGLTQDLDLFLEIEDTTFGSGQLLRFGPADTVLQSLVDEILLFQLYRHDSAIPSDAATSTTVRPDVTNASAWRRNSAGYGSGTDDSFRYQGSQHLSTNRSGKPGEDHGVRKTEATSIRDQRGAEIRDQNQRSIPTSRQPRPLLHRRCSASEL